MGAAASPRLGGDAKVISAGVAVVMDADPSEGKAGEHPCFGTSPPTGKAMAEDRFALSLARDASGGSFGGGAKR
jgi:hypothetical protein